MAAVTFEDESFDPSEHLHFVDAGASVDAQLVYTPEGSRWHGTIADSIPTERAMVYTSNRTHAVERMQLTNGQIEMSDGSLRILFPDGGTWEVPITAPAIYTAPHHEQEMPQPVAFRSPTPIPGAGMFADGVESRDIPPGVWADWLEERGDSPWFAYALRWMEARERWPAEFPVDFSSDRTMWRWYVAHPNSKPWVKEREKASPHLPFALICALGLPGGSTTSDYLFGSLRPVAGGVHELDCDSFPDAVTALAIGLEKLNDALAIPRNA